MPLRYKRIAYTAVLPLLGLLSLKSSNQRLQGTILFNDGWWQGTAKEEDVTFYVDLETDKVVVRLPCTSHKFSKETLLERVVESPDSMIIPAYSLQIHLQTLAECQNDATHQNNLEELQQFLHTMCPLAEIVHKTTSATISPRLMMANSSSFYETALSIGTHSESPIISSQRTPSCSSLRGRYGHWVYNYSYGNQSWYIPNGWIRSNELRNGPYNHSSWVYESNVPSCPMETIHLQGFCEAANALNISRIMVLGDSIEYMRVLSFFHLMEIPSLVHFHVRPKYKMRYAHVFRECHDSPIELVFYRVNHLMPLLGNETVDGPVSAAQVQEIRRAHYRQRAAAEGLNRQQMEYFVCYGISNVQFPDKQGWCPWTHEYLNYDQNKRTMLIGGVGPHFHSALHFREQLDLFMDVVRAHQRPNDIIWLRTILEGHENCDDEKNPIAPLQTFQEFKEKYFADKRIYMWHLFHKYNKMMEREVLKIQMDKHWKGASFQLFDIYWMTALRRDGHPFPTDCLHYLLPGPPDWWNHLFYSNLRELASLKHQ